MKIVCAVAPSKFAQSLHQSLRSGSTSPAKKTDTEETLDESEMFKVLLTDCGCFSDYLCRKKSLQFLNIFDTGFSFFTTRPTIMVR